MANILRIELETPSKRMKIDGDKIVIDKSCNNYCNEGDVEIYACCDQIKCWIGSCGATVKELDEIAGPENLLQTLNETASDYELDLLHSVLWCKENQYMYNGKIEIAIKED